MWLNGLFSISQSQPGLVRLTSLTVTTRFGEYLEFSGRIESDQPVDSLTLTLIPEKGSPANLNTVIGPDGGFSLRYDLIKMPLTPFTRLTYTITFQFASGGSETTQPFSLEYRDTRFNWQTLNGNDVQAYWYDGDLTFGQAVVNTTLEGRRRNLETFPSASLPPLKIVVYASASDLQSGLAISKIQNIAGHTSPESATIFVSIPPGPDAQLEMRRQLPHEIMHILLYQMLGSAYTNTPQWLLEGIATSAELNPNPDFERVLISASQANTLLPMESLCAQFPEDAPAAYLAYAQSGSFVQYLMSTRGKDSLQILLAAYRNGIGCEDAVYQTYGSDLGRLDLEWRRAVLGYEPLTAALNTLLPYIILTASVLLPGLILILLAHLLQKKESVNEP